MYFFRDVSGDSAPLLVRRCQVLPLSEALMLLGPSVTDVDLRREAVKRLRQVGDTESVCVCVCVRRV